MIEEVTRGHPIRFIHRGFDQSTVTVIAYPKGNHRRQMICQSRVLDIHGIMAFHCAGFRQFSSGAPLLVQTKEGMTIIGVIGGPFEGGLSDNRSYASPLGLLGILTFGKAVNGT